MSSLMDRFYERSSYLQDLLNIDPAEAVRQARQLDLDVPDRLNMISLRAAILVDGGALTRQHDAIEEGITLLRELLSKFQNVGIAYNLANGLVAIIGFPPKDDTWLDHQERTRGYRAEARQLFWKVAQDSEADLSLRTQAWTNLGNQLSSSYRLGEAHDAWRAALALDPENGVAAAAASYNLLWLYNQGMCSDITRIEAAMLAKIAHKHLERVLHYAGAQTATEIAKFTNEFEEPPPRSAHLDPFIEWVERERLTLSPAVELIDPALGKLDWIMLPGIRERESVAQGTPPPVFAMFNMLKSDFILARDLAWRASDCKVWPSTGNYADTLDFATYGQHTSALILAHRTALDLLDKVAVTANHYFEIGLPPDKVYFGKLWRGTADKVTGIRPLAKKVEDAVRGGAYALYGIVELAEDYDSNDGILRAQKNLRNAGTHRFVVLHDLGDPTHSRQAPEVKRHHSERFAQEVLSALRVARSAIQMLALAITQHEQALAQSTQGFVAPLIVPDHDWIRGQDEEG